MDNLEPLELLPGLGPEHDLEDAAAWDSDDDELVSFVVQELEDIIFDDEYARQHDGSVVGRQPNLYGDFDSNMARIVKQYLFWHCRDTSAVLKVFFYPAIPCSAADL
jgi:hypothetical protein